MRHLNVRNPVEGKTLNNGTADPVKMRIIMERLQNEEIQLLVQIVTLTTLSIFTIDTRGMHERETAEIQL